MFVTPAAPATARTEHDRREREVLNTVIQMWSRHASMESRV